MQGCKSLGDMEMPRKPQDTIQRGPISCASPSRKWQKFTFKWNIPLFWIWTMEDMSCVWNKEERQKEDENNENFRKKL